MIEEAPATQALDRASAALQLLAGLLEGLPQEPSPSDGGVDLPPLEPVLGRLTAAGLAEAAAVFSGSTLLAACGLGEAQRSQLSAQAAERPARLNLEGRCLQAAWESVESDISLVLLHSRRLPDPSDQALLQGVARLLRLHRHTIRQLRDERQARQAALERIDHDPLTGLPNRLRAIAHLEQLLIRREEAGHSAAAGQPVVLFIDLDNFKSINDAHGHSVGDHFLITVSKLIRQMVHRDDLVARLAGDEFIVISQERRHDDGDLLADRLISEITRPIRIGSHVLSHSASIGIARVSPLDQAETVIENADLAMMEAKRLGRGRSNCFDLELRAAARARASTEDALKRAIHNGEIRCWFQPIVQLPGGGISGFEALARWQDPERGLISPAAFIPVAESSGLIAEIDTLVMRQACMALAGWQHLATAENLHISTNLSVRSLRDQHIGDQIEAALQEAGLGSESLYVEITETMLVDNIDAATSTMARLRRLGVKLAIDDFGTGYSSLRYLKQFPVGFLKIDKSFIDGLGQGGHDDVIVAAVIRMATALGLEVIAEGVEQQEQANLLASLGCQFAQGYLFGRPVDVDVATDLLMRQTPR